MRAACRNCRLHHAKRNLNPLQAPGAGAYIELNTCHACHDDGCAIQPKQPIQCSLPKRPMRFFGAADRVAYTYWLLGQPVFPTHRDGGHFSTFSASMPERTTASTIRVAFRRPISLRTK